MRISDWSSDVCSSDLSALSDSETSISRYISAGTIQQERAAALAAAAEAVELMRRRYVAGEEDLTGLLQAKLAFSAADRLHLQAPAARPRPFAALYKALGGGWDAAEGRSFRPMHDLKGGW